MKLEFEVKNPSAVEFTMHVTMTLQQWQDLDDQLKANEYYKQPSRVFQERISDMIDHANDSWMNDRDVSD